MMKQQESPKNKEKIWIITDFDRTFGGGRCRERNGDGSEPKRDGNRAMSHLHETLELIAEKYEVELVLLTDRGTGQLQCPAYSMEGSEFQIGESGAAAFSMKRHGAIFNPDYEEYVIPALELHKAFYRRFGLSTYSLETGVLCGMRVERHDPSQDLTDVIAFLKEFVKKHKEFRFTDHGDCIVVKPAQIDKLDGIEFCQQLYINSGNPIDWTNVVWLGDTRSDIPAAEFIQKRGGRIAAVGNSSEAYINFVKSHDGYIAKAKYTMGAVEILRWYILGIKPEHLKNENEDITSESAQLSKDRTSPPNPEIN